MDLGIAGLASQFDWRAFIDKLSEIERTPQNRLLLEQSRLEQRGIAYGGISTQLNVLANRVKDLKDATFYDSRATTVGNPSVATASATSGAAVGSHTFDITQLATSSYQQGALNVGHRLNDTSDVDALELSDANFATPRSEERGVGKECRSRWSPYHEKKKNKKQRESTMVKA